jgi:hypothetical protein
VWVKMNSELIDVCVYSLIGWGKIKRGTVLEAEAN